MQRARTGCLSARIRQVCVNEKKKKKDPTKASGLTQLKEETFGQLCNILFYPGCPSVLVAKVNVSYRAQYYSLKFSSRNLVFSGFDSRIQCSNSVGQRRGETRRFPVCKVSTENVGRLPGATTVNTGRGAERRRKRRSEDERMGGERGIGLV